MGDQKIQKVLQVGDQRIRLIDQDGDQKLSAGDKVLVSGRIVDGDVFLKWAESMGGGNLRGAEYRNLNNNSLRFLPQARQAAAQILGRLSVAQALDLKAEDGKTPIVGRLQSGRNFQVFFSVGQYSTPVAGPYTVPTQYLNIALAFVAEGNHAIYQDVGGRMLVIETSQVRAIKAQIQSDISAGRAPANALRAFEQRLIEMRS